MTGFSIAGSIPPPPSISKLTPRGIVDIHWYWFNSSNERLIQLLLPVLVVLLVHDTSSTITTVVLM